MGRCIDCVHYPWLRDADPTYLPVHRCHAQLPARRWTPQQLREQNSCPFFAPVEGAEPEPVQPAEGAEVDDPAPEPGPEPAVPEESPPPSGGMRVYNLPGRSRGRGKS